MPSDTFAEVVEFLADEAAVCADSIKVIDEYDIRNHHQPTKNQKAARVELEKQHAMFLKAARLLEAAGRENTAAAARIAELEGVLREIAKEEDGGYGFYHGGDPRKFCPDAEGCTPKELADHKAACEKWDEAEAKGEKLEPEPDGSGWISPSVHVTRSAYGMGSYTYPTHAAVLASAALTPPTKEAP